MRVIINIASVVIFLLILGIGVSTADTEADVGAENVSQWGLPKAAKARLGKGGINVLAFSADGAQFAVGSNIGIWLYDMATGKEVAMFSGMCQSVAFSPDRTVLVASFGSRIELWDLATGDKLTTLDGHTALVDTLLFSPNGKTLVSAGRDGTILLWDWDAARGGT